MIGETRLFKNVWRFNALIIACVGVLALVTGLFALYKDYKEITMNVFRSEMVNLDLSVGGEGAFRFGSVQSISKGAQSVMVPLYSDQKLPIGFHTKLAQSTRNMLFLNTQTKTNQWLLPHHDFLIERHLLITETNNYGGDVRAILYSVIKGDTNNDSRLAMDDNVTIALSDPDGGRYTEVVESADDVLGHAALGKEDVAIIYTQGGQGYTVYVSLTDFKIKKEVALPEVK